MNISKLKNIPSTVWQSNVLELIALKRAIYLHLTTNRTVSYKDRAYIVPTKSVDGSLVVDILKADAPDSRIQFSSNKTAPAVDQFIALFYMEDTFASDDILFHHTEDLTSAGYSWRFIKTRGRIEELITGFQLHN